MSDCSLYLITTFVTECHNSGKLQSQIKFSEGGTETEKQNEGSNDSCSDSGWRWLFFIHSLLGWRKKLSPLLFPLPTYTCSNTPAPHSKQRYGLFSKPHFRNLQKAQSANGRGKKSRSRSQQSQNGKGPPPSSPPTILKTVEKNCQAPPKSLASSTATPKIEMIILKKLASYGCKRY